MKSIYAISAAYSRVFIAVDALDEYQDCSEFLEKLFEIHDHQNLNIFATSRPIPEIRQKFKRRETYRECEIRASDKDVKGYLEGRILQLGTNVVKVNKELIKDKISELTQGMFLLAHLQFEAIKSAPTLRAIKKILAGFSNGGGVSNSAYDSTYSAIMEKIQGNSDKELVDMAFKVLTWITCASRRLTKAELQHAIAVEPEEPAAIDRDNISDIEDLISPCLGLVTIDEKSNIVRLIHYTAQDYLERTKQRWFRHPHNFIARVCTIYLSYDAFKSGPCASRQDLVGRLGLNPLYRYAAENLGYHVRESSFHEHSCCVEPGADCHKIKTGATEHILKFLLDDDLRLACAQVLYGGAAYAWFRARADIDEIQAVHVAASLGLARAAELLLARSGVDLELKGNAGGTPLLLAADRGHEDVVKLLIDRRANLEAKDEYGCTPLYRAVISGREETTKLLIQYGANLAASSDGYSTPLHAAEARGHEGTIRLLVDRMVNVEIKRVECDVAFFSVRYGYEDILRSMLKRGVDLKGLDAGKKYQSFLWAALRHGHEDVVRLLLVDVGVDPDRKGWDGRSPLLFATERGWEGVVRLLVDKADLEAEDWNYRTPLSVAVNARRRDFVEQLLENGALVTPRALRDALENKDEDMVNLLLERKQDLKGADYRGETLLFTAVRYRHEAGIRLLISEGANIEAENKDRETPLLAAVRGASEAVVILLFEASIKIGRDKSEVAQKALFAAANAYGFKSPESENIIDYLIKMGADLEAEDEYGETALLIAIRCNQKEIVGCLLKKGARSTANLVSHAVRSNSKDVVGFLIDKGADLEGVDDTDYGRTALFYAAKQGNEGSVRALVEAGADLEAHDKNGDTPLSVSARDNHKAVVEFLLNRGAYIETKNKYGRTPLFIAAQRGHVEIVGLLVHNGANLETSDNRYRTPRSIASKNGHESTVRLLADKEADWETESEDGGTPLVPA
ncbi:hypothetical protein TWF481_010430 [Arthrobotrys musiformis]|uniref:GPI inositol-deacylase winged helix domain-containing protein n=1 Tax=Arthrobotrys musiformis TaxID=47236 RepID=A0AAV9W0X7_9PEZI